METKKIQQIDLFESRDQYISALLFSMGLKLEDTRRDGNVVFFIFENKQKCEEIQKKFYQNQLKINPKNFIDGLITIKHLIFGN